LRLHSSGIVDTKGQVFATEKEARSEAAAVAREFARNRPASTEDRIVVADESGAVVHERPLIGQPAYLMSNVGRELLVFPAQFDGTNQVPKCLLSDIPRTNTMCPAATTAKKAGSRRYFARGAATEAIAAQSLRKVQRCSGTGNRNYKIWRSARVRGFRLQLMRTSTLEEKAGAVKADILRLTVSKLPSQGSFGQLQ
jgi:hypothetical protein